MTYFLETSELGFRNWLPDDFPLAKALWSEPQVTQTIFENGPLTDEEIKDKLILEMATVKKFGVQLWPFFRLEDGEFIGVCGLSPYLLFEGIFEMSVQIIPKYWNNGYGYKACNSMIEHTFNTLNIKSIFAGHHPNNLIAASLLKKLKFRFTHMEYYQPTGVNHNSYILNAEEFVEP